MRNFPNGELSFLWTCSAPPPENQVNKKEALAELDKMWNKLSKTQQKVRSQAYEKAKVFISESPAEGRPQVSKSFKSPREAKNRIDVEVITGKSFRD